LQEIIAERKTIEPLLTKSGVDHSWAYDFTTAAVVLQYSGSKSQARIIKNTIAIHVTQR
jgi:hypothetical protein